MPKRDGLRTKDNLINKVHSMGEEYFLLHSEIKPFGKGTRRYMLGRHIEIPTELRILPSGNPLMSPGKQEYLNDPMDGINFVPWLDKYIANLKK